MQNHILESSQGLTEQQQRYMSYQSVHDIEDIRDQIDQIAQEILRITLVIKQKNIKDINKNFQATLTNYFLECQVCQLLTKPMKVQYKRDVRKIVENILNCQLNSTFPNEKKSGQMSSALLTLNKSRINNQKIRYNTHHHINPIADLLITKSNDPSNEAQQTKQNENEQSKLLIQSVKRRFSELSTSVRSTISTSSQYIKKEKTAKYILLIGIYSDFIDSFNLKREYIEVLLDNIKSNSINANYIKDSQKYITLYQKKLCAILVLQYYLRKEEQPHIKSFCDLWNSVFLNHKLFYFARETNIFYNKIQINDLIEGCNTKTNTNSNINAGNRRINNKEITKKCKIINQNLSNSPQKLQKKKEGQTSSSLSLDKEDKIEENDKIFAQYSTIQQERAIVKLNYFEWAEQVFFKNSLESKPINLLKIMPDQQAVSFSNDQMSQNGYQSLNDETVNSFNYTVGDHSKSQNNPCRIQIVCSRKDNMIFENNTRRNRIQEKLQKVLKSKFNNDAIAKQNCKNNQVSNVLYPPKHKSSEFVPKNGLQDKLSQNSMNETSSKINKNNVQCQQKVQNKQSNHVKIQEGKSNISLSHKTECVENQAKYRIIQQTNSRQNSMSQQLQYLSQFFSVKGQQLKFEVN